MFFQALEVLEDHADGRDGVVEELVPDGLASFLFEEPAAGDSDGGFPVHVVGKADATGV